MAPRRGTNPPESVQSDPDETASADDRTATPGRQRFRRTAAVRQRAHSRRATSIAWKAGVFVIGWAVVAAGVAMLVLPGPGWAAIFVGLAILATEYAWAHRLLSRAKAFAQGLADRALDPKVRRRNQSIAAVLLIATVAASVWYYGEYGFTLDGPRSWF